MEKISSTDVECLWKALRPSVQVMYNPVPLNDFCCSKSSHSLQINSEDANFFRDELFKACPESAVVRHTRQKFSWQTKVTMYVFRISDFNFVSDTYSYTLIFERKMLNYVCILYDCVALLLQGS